MDGKRMTPADPVSEGHPDSAVAKSVKSDRRYSARTLKILWVRCGNRCASPGCGRELVTDATELDEVAILGKIAHIHSSSDGGPRSKPEMTAKERDHPNNLILLCGYHHDLVDAQDSTYSADLLRKWKADHEAEVAERQRRSAQDAVAKVTFRELEAAAQAVAAIRPKAGTGLTSLPTERKMSLNELGSDSRFALQLGAFLSTQVARFIVSMNQIDPEFGDRLRAGFVAEYEAQRSAGLRGDDLFAAMLAFAESGSRDDVRRTAGLAILTHLFILCDVFETDVA